jgi:hypothetical protein
MSQGIDFAFIKQNNYPNLLHKAKESSVSRAAFPVMNIQIFGA